jgi:hypothetical protein
MKLFEEFIVEKYGGLFTFNELVEEGLPKLSLKIETVKRKLKKLETERKEKFSGNYAKRVNEEEDLTIKKNLLKPVVEITKKIKFLETTLDRLIELEDKYITELSNRKQINELAIPIDTIVETGKLEADLSIIENSVIELSSLLQEQRERDNFSSIPDWVILKIECAKDYIISANSYLNK